MLIAPGNIPGEMGLQTRSLIPLTVLVVVHVALVYCLSALLRSNDEFSISSAVIIALSTSLVLGSWKFAQNLLLLDFPGPIPYPIVGNILSLIAQGNVQESTRHLCKTYGPAVEIILMDGSRAVIVNDPLFCKTAIKSMDRGDLEGPNDHLNKFRENLLWFKIFSLKGLDLFSRSDKIGDWKTRRRILQPAFDQRHVRAMQKDINESIGSLLDKLAQTAVDNDGGFDVTPILEDFGLEVLCKTSLGFHNDLIHDDSSRWLIDHMKLATHLFSEYFFDPFVWLKIKVLAPIGVFPVENQRHAGGNRFRQFATALFEKEKTRQNKEGSSKENLMSILFSISKEHMSDGFDDDAIVDEVVSFMFAGHDTTSTTLSVFLHYLATYPVVQMKLHAHIDEALKGTNGDDFGDILKEHPLPFLSACIRESQRLQPVAPILPRRIQEDIPISKHLLGGETGKVVRKGSKVFVPCFLLHRDETVYPDPELFQPERWIEGDGSLKPVTPGYFYAFGGGPKMCVGIQLAEKNLRMTSLGILSKFKVEPAANGIDLKIIDAFVTGPEYVRVKLSIR
jgi:cytochrome P450